VAILARLLTPSDYGVFALLLIVLTFLMVISNAGLNEATLQSRLLSHVEASSLYWFNVLVGCVMAVICAAVSPLAAWFFHSDALIPTLSVMGLSFPIGALGAQHRALLQRSMRYRLTAACDIAAQLVGLVVAVAFALGGAGYWSLVALQISAAATSSVCLMIATRWRPGRPHITERIKALVTFGMNVTGFQIANFFGTNTDNILIGRVLGVFQLGSYSRAYNLLIAPLTQILIPVANVLIVTLSRVGTSDASEFRATFKAIATKINLLLIPLTAFMILNAHAIVRVVLGPQWEEAAKIFTILGIGGLVEPTITMIGWVLIAEGRSRDYLLVGITRAPAMVVGFFVGVRFGVLGVAAGYSVVTCVSLIPILWFVGRRGPVTSGAVYETGLLGALTATTVVASSLAVHALIPSAGALASLFIAAAAAAVVVVPLIVAVPPLRSEVGNIRRLLVDAFAT